MSNSSTNVIKRLLHIIQFLLDSNYVSTTDIQVYLTEQGIDVPIRTIQRDMVMLEDIIPLESRKEDKPYSWRWQRLQSANIHQLSITQAIALRVVETELKGVIPDELYDSLQPLFVKSHYVTGLSQLTDIQDKINQPKLPKLPKIKGNKNNRSPSQFIKGSPLQEFLLEIRHFYEEKKNAKDKIRSMREKMKLTNDDQQAIENLADELNNQDLTMLVELLRSEG